MVQVLIGEEPHHRLQLLRGDRCYPAGQQPVADAVRGKQPFIRRTHVGSASGPATEVTLDFRGIGEHPTDDQIDLRERQRRVLLGDRFSGQALLKRLPECLQCDPSTGDANHPIIVGGQRQRGDLGLGGHDDLVLADG